MEFKRRRDWQEGRSIIVGRSEAGQIIFKGSIYGKPGGPHRFLVRVGKDVAVEVTGKKEDAGDALRKLSWQAEVGISTPKHRRMRFDTFLRKIYLPWVRNTKEAKTFAEYERSILREIIPHFGRFRLDQLDHQMIQDWVYSLWHRGLKEKTVKAYFSMIRAPLNRAVTLDLILKNPAQGATIRPPKTRAHVDLDDEVPGGPGRPRRSVHLCRGGRGVDPAPDDDGSVRSRGARSVGGLVESRP